MLLCHKFEINTVKMLRLYICLLVFISYGHCGVIIPEELPSLLSVAYSNIPPIKKGTDSRVGFGFAFGNHADFQVVYEFGPQTNTNPIGQTFPSNTKRQAPQKDTVKETRKEQSRKSKNKTTMSQIEQ